MTLVFQSLGLRRPCSFCSPPLSPEPAVGKDIKKSAVKGSTQRPTTQPSCPSHTHQTRERSCLTTQDVQTKHFNVVWVQLLSLCVVLYAALSNILLHLIHPAARGMNSVPVTRKQRRTLAMAPFPGSLHSSVYSKNVKLALTGLLSS